MRKRSSALLIALALPLVASAQLSIGVERPLGTPDPEVFSRVDEIDVASSGETIVVVGIDHRTDRGADIVATRLDRFAALRDPASIPLTSTPGLDESRPLVIYDGDRFVVVWESGDGNAMAAELDRAGQISQEPVVLAEGTPGSLLVINGQTLITIEDRSGTTLYRMRDDLKLVDIEDFPRRYDVRVTRLGENGLFIGWPEFEFPSGRMFLRGLRMDSRGRIIQNAPITALGTFNREAEFVVETFDDDAIIAVSAQDRFIVARMTPDGTVSLIHTDETDIERSVRDIVPRGDGFDVLMIVAGRARILRFNETALATESTPVAGNVDDAAGVMATGRVYTVWQTAGVVSARFAFAGSNEPPVTLSRSAPSQQLPALASDGAGVLAVWTEDVDETTDRIMARLLLPDGTPVTAGKGLTVATRTMTPFDGAPAVAFSGGNYLVLWTDQRRGADKPANLMMRTVTRDAIAGEDVTVSTTAHQLDDPAIASDGNNALLVWTENPLTGAQVRAALASAPQAKFDIPETRIEPAVVFGNGSYVVAGTTSLGSIRGTLVSRTGAIERTLFDTAGTDDGEAAIAWNGRSHYLVVFRRETSIYGRLLDRNGTTVGSSFPIVTGTIAHRPTVAWDGHAFVVAFTVRPFVDEIVDGDVYAARVTTKAEVSPATVVSATDRNDDFPALLGLIGGKTLIAYQRMTGELQNVHRIYTRLATTPAPPLPKRRAVR